MEVNFKKDGWVARMYMKFFMTRTLPVNLCPYWWSVVYMAVVAVPFILLQWPYSVLNKVMKHEPFAFRSREERFVFSFLSLLTQFVIFVVGYEIIYLSPAEWAMIKFVSSVAVTFILISTIYYIVNYIKNSRPKVDKYLRDNNGYILRDDHYNPVMNPAYKESLNNIIISYLKGIYNRTCPHINWQD
jgi:hypothetical protein